MSFDNYHIRYAIREQAVHQRNFFFKSARKRILEAVYVGIVLLLTFFLLRQRIEHREFPSGDEGSWMGVAAQLERGEGFTTRWYEHPYLDHQLLPRPDDYRYPGLTLPLAAMFRLFGTSYAVALYTVAVLQLLFLFLLFMITRRLYGSAVGCSTLAVTALSLLQLEWNSAVYSEGMFGIGLSLVTMAVLFLDRSNYRTWVIIGLSCALLYYIRPNGILLLGGLPVYLLFHRKEGRRVFVNAGICFASFLVSAMPWLLRYVLYFGNPLHVAGGASVLRIADDDPLTWSFAEFIRHYSPFIPFKMIGTGSGHFFIALHFFEKNLFILPLIGVIIRIIRKRCRGDALLAPFYILTTVACCYISYRHSWAAVRYMAALLPFIYAYGIAELTRIVRSRSRLLPATVRFVPLAILTAVLVAPVYYPHRFYLRKFSRPVTVDRTYAGHRRLIERLVPENGYYLADAYGQLAFLSTRRCAGIQTFVDSSMIPVFLKRYNPSLLVLGAREETNPRIQGIKNALIRQGMVLDPVARHNRGTYYVLHRVPPQPESAGRNEKHLPVD